MLDSGLKRVINNSLREVGKNKLKRFNELEYFDRVFQPPIEEILRKDHSLKGNWNSEVFGNDHPIVLELGCGKGEYTIGLAGPNPDRNYIGIDIKGARIWKGAKTAFDKELKNVAFLRTRIELIQSFFQHGEVDEIWIIFPDPQLKRRRNKKRLSGTTFLNLYRNILKDNGLIHLKSDNDILYNYTLELATYNKLEILNHTSDLYSSDTLDQILSIRTFYENQFLEEGKNINYLSFRLPAEKVISEFGYEEE